MKFGNEFWLILFREYISPNLFAVRVHKYVQYQSLKNKKFKIIYICLGPEIWESCGDTGRGGWGLPRYVGVHHFRSKNAWNIVFFLIVNCICRGASATRRQHYYYPSHRKGWLLRLHCSPLRTSNTVHISLTGIQIMVEELANLPYLRSYPQKCLIIKFHVKLSDDDFPIVSFFFKFFSMMSLWWLRFAVGKYSAAAF
jgi:hypothetical protein